MSRRIWIFIIKEFIQAVRNPILLLLIVLGPLAEMALIAWATSAPIEHLPTAVVDLDRSRASRELLVALDNTETFELRAYLDDVDAVGPLVESGQVVGALIIPPEYSNDLNSPLGQTATLSFILDGSDPVAAQVELGSVEGVVASQSQKVLAGWMGTQSAAISLVQPQLRVRFNETLKKSVYTIPSELGAILFAVGVMLASMTIAKERELGTLEQLMTTPVRRFELIAAKAVPVTIMSYTVFLLMLLVAIAGFGLPMRGSWPLLLGASLLFLGIELSIGLMISAVARNQVQGMLGAMLWVMTEFFFSGYGVPVENMPNILQTLAHIFPIYHFMIIFRAVLLKGAGLGVIWPNLLAGVIIGAVVIPAAVWFLGRQQWT